MKAKSMREKGKLKLSRYFQELKAGDRVSVNLEKSLQPSIPQRMQGRTGVVEGKRGKAVIVKIKDQNKEKIFLIEPIHLIKLKDK